MTENRLIPLPNKDLWRGHTRQDETPVEQVAAIATEVLSPLDQAFKNVIETAKGGPLNCTYCGQQFQWMAMREHLDKNHLSITHPLSEAEIALQPQAAKVE